MPDERLSLLIRLAAAFPRDRVEQSTVMVIASELSDISLADFNAVIAAALHECKSFPTIAELRGIYRRQLTQRRSQQRPALRESSSPMPPYVREQIADLKTRMNERAEDLEPVNHP